jgi:hypothetical protein
MLAAGENLDRVRVQLSRWAASGRVVRIHKGWYALAYHGMIPEHA